MNGVNGYSPSQGGAYSVYGAMPPYAQGGLDKSPFARGGLTRSVSLATLATNFAVPWFVFALIFSLESTPTHYSSPQLIALLILVMATGCFAFIAMAINSWRRRFEGSEPFWPTFMAVTATLALVVGVVAGYKNFEENMVPFMDISNLNEYKDINPGTSTGQQLMDAGRVDFTAGSKLDTTLSMGFRNLETYCVAPVVSGGGKPDSYDFWAVGLNCCSAHLPDFHCGEFSNPKARSGVRLVREEYRSFFELAVKQAEAAYNIKAEHPLFVYWLQEPMAEVNAYQDDAYKYMLLGLGAYLGVQGALVLLGLAAFHKGS